MKRHNQSSHRMRHTVEAILGVPHPDAKWEATASGNRVILVLVAAIVRRA
jgi:hypothetical protein